MCRKNSSVSAHYAGNREYDLRYRKKFRELIRLNAAASKYVEEDYRRILAGKTGVLGVLCRGTDYALARPSGHPIQPAAADVIQTAKEVMAKRSLDYLYLATEDQHIFEQFQAEWGERLLTNSQLRYEPQDLSGSVQRIAEVKLVRRDRDRYWTNLEYLSSLHLLSKCTSFIGGSNGGTKAVYFLSDGFEYDYVWDLGLYP